MHPRRAQQGGSPDAVVVFPSFVALQRLAYPEFHLACAAILFVWWG